MLWTWLIGVAGVAIVVDITFMAMAWRRDRVTQAALKAATEALIEHTTKHADAVLARIDQRSNQNAQEIIKILRTRTPLDWR